MTGRAAVPQPSTTDHLDLMERHSAPNYAPLPVVVSHGEGAWVRDVEGRRLLDMLASYSALNFGHRHPALIAAAREQLDRLTLTSRAFLNDQLGPFCAELAELTGMELILPMNTGAEAVETGIKTARKWGYERKGVAADGARIVVCEGGFHGRTTTIVGFSSDPVARGGFGPFAPGFDIVPFGDPAALRSAITPDTVAFLFEPIQGEQGVVLPPDGYLQAVREICDDTGILMIADEIQSGLGRTGRTFACEHEDVRPDMLLLGKALGGGLLPLSAVASSREVLGLMTPGTHGSTFGGNPLACAVGRAVLAIVRSGEVQEASARLGTRMLDTLGAADLSGVTELRGRGLWIGIDVDPEFATARQICERLLAEGVLAKDAHERTVRLAPPLTISEADLDWAIERLIRVLR
jgi:ornithine--oxo-acid transaminase